MGKLFDKLKNNEKSDVYPFHMPGHKRNISLDINPYGIDITEIDGFDDLHNTHEVLKELNEKAAEIYKCKKALIMTNGSTGGVLTAISAALDYNETILICRNSHKSAYNAVMLKKLNPIYIFPQQDDELGINQAISPEIVESNILKNSGIKALFITSPTYEGIISDIESIVRIAHKYNVPVIVDAAHGAHLGLSNKLEKNPSELGADIVIMSIHKTLPALTQSAVLCYNSELIDYEKVKEYFDIYITSSPSYLIMASIEKCFDLIENKKVFDIYLDRLNRFYNRMSELSKLYIYKPLGKFDISKIIVATNHSEINGTQLKDILLKEFYIQVEMVSNEYVIAMTSIMDTDNGFERLSEALLTIDKRIKVAKKCILPVKITPPVYTEYNEKEKVTINLLDADECISCNYIYIYPPGIPIVTPGEIITKDIIEYIEKSKKDRLNIVGLKNSDNDVNVVRRK